MAVLLFWCGAGVARAFLPVS